MTLGEEWTYCYALLLPKAAAGEVTLGSEAVPSCHIMLW